MDESVISSLSESYLFIAVRDEYANPRGAPVEESFFNPSR